MRKTRIVRNILHVDSDVDGKTLTLDPIDRALVGWGRCGFLFLIHAGIFLVRVRFDVYFRQIRGAEFEIERRKV
jgi:hypothetical protein